jgi:predicted  nucleic acid-binding Zn-ribbon protein
MTVNEILTKQNFLSKILFKNEGKDLSTDLKVKIMSMRIEFSKVRKQFDEDLQEFGKGLTDDKFTALSNKENKTEEENAQLNELTKNINEAYAKYANERGLEEVEVKQSTFTNDEYFEIVEVNAGADVEINGTKISSGDFLEIFYSLFVE